MTTITPTSHSPLVQQILALASRREGYGTKDTPEITTNISGRACGRLVKQGLLYRVEFSYKSVRWFTKASDAKHSQGNPFRTPRKPTGAYTYPKEEKAPKGEAITPPHVKVQYIPCGFQERFTAIDEFHPLLKNRTVV